MQHLQKHWGLPGYGQLETLWSAAAFRLFFGRTRLARTTIMGEM